APGGPLCCRGAFGRHPRRADVIPCPGARAIIAPMYQLFTFSEAGGHPVNEDAFEALPPPAAPDCPLCAPAAGPRGQPGGRPPSRLACRAAVEAASQVSPSKFPGLAAWLAVLRAADAAVCADAEAGFTTLLGFCVTGEALCGASSGDSAVLLANGDGRV